MDMSLGSRLPGKELRPALHARCLLVRCGHPEPSVAREHGCFAAWFRRVIDPRVELDVVDIRTEPFVPSRLDGVGAVMVTGSPHSVYDPHPWLASLDALVREAVLVRAIPYLGVCFGHQALAQACGGEVAKNPRGREMGTIPVALNPMGRQSPLFDGLTDVFDAQATHCDTVVRPPPGARVLAASAKDDCQAFTLGTAWGVQFHPEVTAEVLRGYVRARAERLRTEGIDPDTLHDAIRDTAAGRRIVDNFLSMAFGLTPEADRPAVEQSTLQTAGPMGNAPMECGGS